MYLFFFFKQKTAYEMRISDWSSDVCSSDLRQCPHRGPVLPENRNVCLPESDYCAEAPAACRLWPSRYCMKSLPIKTHREIAGLRRRRRRPHAAWPEHCPAATPILSRRAPRDSRATPPRITERKNVLEGKRW